MPGDSNKVFPSKFVLVMFAMRLNILLVRQKLTVDCLERVFGKAVN